MKRLLKKWALLSVAAALVVIGCGGSGNSSTGASTTTSATSGTTGSSIQINIASTDQSGNTYGTADFLYLTGRARNPGDLTAVVKRITIQDQYGQVTNPNASETKLPLTLYTSQKVSLDVPFTTQNSRLFENFSLDFLRFEEEGSTEPLNPPPSAVFPSRIRLFPGRNTCIPIFLDDSMYTDNGVAVVDPATGVAEDGTAFNSSAFSFVNLDSNGRLVSFLSDYVEFDISSLAVTDLPQLTTGDYAGKFFISGDNLAVGVSASRGPFQVLTQDATQPLVGNYGPENSIGGNNTPGTYDLTQINPADITQTAKITSLQGIWRDYNNVMSGLGAFQMIVFPSIQDGTQCEFVLVSRNGTTITSLYYGVLDYALGKFQAWPIKDVVNASVTGELDGTVSSFHDANGSITTVSDAIRTGTFTFGSGSKFPTGKNFQSTGTFVVFRK